VLGAPDHEEFIIQGKTWQGERIGSKRKFYTVLKKIKNGE
jgi:hypothetical protein